MGPVVSRNTITTKSADSRPVGMPGLEPIFDRAWMLGGGENPAMDVMKLMVALAGWISRQQEDVIDYATTVSGLADCFATTTAGITWNHHLPAIPVFGHYGR